MTDTGGTRVVLTASVPATQFLIWAPAFAGVSGLGDGFSPLGWVLVALCPE